MDFYHRTPPKKMVYKAMDDLGEIYWILLDGNFNSTSTLISDVINNEKIEDRARTYVAHGLEPQRYDFMHDKHSFIAQDSIIGQ